MTNPTIWAKFTVSKRALTDWESNKTRQWSDLGPIKKQQTDHAVDNYVGDETEDDEVDGGIDNEENEGDEYDGYDDNNEDDDDSGGREEEEAHSLAA